MTNRPDAAVRTVLSCPIPEVHLVSPLVGQVLRSRGDVMPLNQYVWSHVTVLMLEGGMEPLPCAPLDQLYPDARGVNALQGWCVDG